MWQHPSVLFNLLSREMCILLCNLPNLWTSTSIRHVRSCCNVPGPDNSEISHPLNATICIVQNFYLCWISTLATPYFLGLYRLLHIQEQDEMYISLEAVVQETLSVSMWEDPIQDDRLPAWCSRCTHQDQSDIIWYTCEKVRQCNYLFTCRRSSFMDLYGPLLLF